MKNATAFLSLFALGAVMAVRTSAVSQTIETMTTEMNAGRDDDGDHGNWGLAGLLGRRKQGIVHNTHPTPTLTARASSSEILQHRKPNKPDPRIRQSNRTMRNGSGRNASGDTFCFLNIQ